MTKKAGKKTGKRPARMPVASAAPRRLKRPVKLPSVWRLTRTATATLWQHKKIFVGITLVYGLLSLILVHGLGNTTDVATLKGELNQVFTGHLGSVASGLSIFVVLLGSAGGGASSGGSPYQLILVLVTSLAVIWALRQVLAGAVFRIRDAYYRGMYPLVPFVLVVLVIGLQLIPLIIGSTVYGVVITNGIAVHIAEKLLWLLLFVMLALWTLYMLSSSLFALYIVTLPDMTPLQALRSARKLTRSRRWTLLRKILCLPVVLLVVAAVIMLPIIIWLTPLTQWIFFLLTMFAVAAVHTYMYTLYRELLNE